MQCIASFTGVKKKFSAVWNNFSHRSEDEVRDLWANAMSHTSSVLQVWFVSTVTQPSNWLERLFPKMTYYIMCWVGCWILFAYWHNFKSNYSCCSCMFSGFCAQTALNCVLFVNLQIELLICDSVKIVSQNENFVQ